MWFIKRKSATLLLQQICSSHFNTYLTGLTAGHVYRFVNTNPRQNVVCAYFKKLCYFEKLSKSQMCTPLYPQFPAKNIG